MSDISRRLKGEADGAEFSNGSRIGLILTILKRRARLYEACNGSMNLREPRQLGETALAPLIKSAPLAK